MLLKVIIASTRPGRKGLPIANWITELAKKHGAFDVEVLDLLEINLPFLDEPQLPRFQKYEHEHTKKWSAMIDAADAFIIVTPEYNFGFPASIKNALDFLYNEWNYKAVAFVSYGGVAAGTRAIQMLKQVVTEQKMMPIVESVNIPFFTKYITEQGVFAPEEDLEKSAYSMMDELAKWSASMAVMRPKK